VALALVVFGAIECLPFRLDKPALELILILGFVARLSREYSDKLWSIFLGRSSAEKSNSGS